jgi:hypothetical protein
MVNPGLREWIGAGDYGLMVASRSSLNPVNPFWKICRSPRAVSVSCIGVLKNDCADARRGTPLRRNKYYIFITYSGFFFANERSIVS